MVWSGNKLPALCRTNRRDVTDPEVLPGEQRGSSPTLDNPLPFLPTLRDLCLEDKAP